MQNLNDAIDNDVLLLLAPTWTPADKETQHHTVNAKTDIEHVSSSKNEHTLADVPLDDATLNPQTSMAQHVRKDQTQAQSRHSAP
jgi:hypothetical protein